MMGLVIEIEIGVYGLVVHFVPQRSIRSPVNIQVQEKEVAFTFGFLRSYGISLCSLAI
jgi:hypothetical protein